ncbi:MAG: MBL fold metallo-hydrolase [Acidimicrobiia bacterium]
MTKDMDRRQFFRASGAGAIGIAIFGIAACSSNSSATTSTSATVVSSTSNPVTTDVASYRIALGGVSAYVIQRGDGLIVVDTGNPGSLQAITAAIEEHGQSFSDVGYVIATHKHNDHVGSLNDVLAAAPEADVFGGAGDIPVISSNRPITPLADGAQLNGVSIIETPGHTDGHISVLDPDVGLFAGDALNGADGGVVGPNPRYTPDMELANESVKKLATYTYGQAFFGHGEPVLSNASQQVGALAATL